MMTDAGADRAPYVVKAKTEVGCLRVTIALLSIALLFSRPLLIIRRRGIE